MSEIIVDQLAVVKLKYVDYNIDFLKDSPDNARPHLGDSGITRRYKEEVKNLAT